MLNSVLFICETKISKHFIAESLLPLADVLFSAENILFFRTNRAFEKNNCIQLERENHAYFVISIKTKRCGQFLKFHSLPLLYVYVCVKKILYSMFYNVHRVE